MKLVAKYHLEKAKRIVVVLSALQEVHGAMAENVTKEVDENMEGDQILYLLSVMMMLLGMVLMKVAGNGTHEGPPELSVGTDGSHGMRKSPLL